MRLIDADAMHMFVVDKVTEGKDGWANGVPYEWAYALTAVDMMPTIDAEPVRHGKWIDKLSDCYWPGDKICSECGAEYSFCKVQNYCPNCGAKMDAKVT